jgi:hypothetical protein
MSSSIRFGQKVMTIVAMDNGVMPNSYDISFTVTMHTDKPHQQNMVIERLKFFLDSMVSDTIMIEHNSSILEPLRGTLPENNIMVLPAPPYDTTVSEVLYVKAQSILDDCATIDVMTLSSYLGQDIEYFADSDDDFSEYAHCSWLPKNQEPWWLRSDVTTSDLGEPLPCTWDDIGLGWDEPKKDPEKSSGVIDETTIIRFPKFEPKVVTGGPDAT